MIRWLQGKALLANPLHCRQCNKDMELRPRGDEHIDGFRWQVSILFFTKLYRVPNATLSPCFVFPQVFISERSETLQIVFSLLRRYLRLDKLAECKVRRTDGKTKKGRKSLTFIRCDRQNTRALISCNTR